MVVSFMDNSIDRHSLHSTVSGTLLSCMQAFKLKFRWRDFNFCLCSAATLAVCIKGRVAGADAIETRNEFKNAIFTLFIQFSLTRQMGFDQ